MEASHEQARGENSVGDRLPFGDGHIIYFRTAQDYHCLRALAEQGQRFAVIGGGFIGSEIAAALATNGKQVTRVFPDEAIGARVYPHDLSLFLNDSYRQKGVEVMAGESVIGLEARGERLALTIHNVKASREQEILVDGIVAGIGLQPNVELAQAAGLELENGIVVDEFLGTSHPDIYAAGDVAAFYNPTLTFSIWAMKQSENSIRGTRLWQIGRSQIKREWSITCSQDECAACSCGMSGIRWKQRGS